MDIPITQSEAWKKLQDDLGEESRIVENEDFHFLVIVKKTPFGKYLYCPYGPVFDTKEGFKKSINALKKIANKEKAFFLRVEPQNLFAEPYLRANGRKIKDIDPKDTWVLDLTDDIDKIVSNFSQGTRTRFNTYKKKGLFVLNSQSENDIGYLFEFQDKLYRRKKINSFSEEYLKTELDQDFASLYVVKYKNPDSKKETIVAASLFFDYGDVRYYMQSAADEKYKKLPATVALLTQAIFDAKEKKIKKFDFWGIAPDNADKTHPWYGLTQFKKSFGGEAVHYVGTYDIVLNPSKYVSFGFVRSLNRFYRHLLHKK